MHDVKVIEKSKNIFGLSWIGNVTPDDVQQVNKKLADIFRSSHTKTFDLIVDMNEITVLLPETQKEIVAHQEWLLESGMKRAAVVVSSALAKLQLKRTAKESSNGNEFHFSTYEEALEFLSEEKQSIS
ncbi:SpoIIAA family protein [Aquibacillus rhizosphaerae]|uniref:STAS/SEC14 domain-containing protein n=1 Tax=Aquibacillus rhizosphaerae TaxID=3051431 RepID=A0ABT7L557_9BACI|nr:STAS/SEC14 domain-containing protein [Aquibacillus sp. LR5S19]MDL4841001.1 STAS/SEC14 domain-containing protein [Aquibacillus sp. LR5S19]